MRRYLYSMASIVALLCTSRYAESLASLDLNGQGNEIVVSPEEKIRAILNISFDEEEIDPYKLYQIVIGYDEGPAQKCILNEFGYRLGDAIKFFFLEAPAYPGEYHIQFCLTQQRSPLEAMQLWGSDVSRQMTIGTVIVLE